MIWPTFNITPAQNFGKYSKIYEGCMIHPSWGDFCGRNGVKNGLSLETKKFSLIFFSSLPIHGFPDQNVNKKLKKKTAFT